MLTDVFSVAVLNLVDRDVIVVDAPRRGVDAGESAKFPASGRRCILARTRAAVPSIEVFEDKTNALRIDRPDCWSRE